MSDSRPQALLCAPLLPEYDREGGSRRLFNFVEFLTEAGWEVTFATRHGRGGERYVEVLQQRGVETYTSLGNGLDRAIATGQFAVAILAFWYLAEECIPRIRRLSPQTRVLVDSIDLHFLRNARRALFGRGAGRAAASLDASYAGEMVRELNAYAAADGVLAVSAKEAALIDDLAGGPNLAHVVPLAEDLEPSPIPFAERKGILFVGNFNHPPNVEGAQHLLREILPRVDSRLLADHPMYVVGNAMTQKLQHLVAGPNIRLVGWVPSVLPYLHRARITVVPLLHGAGTKHKLIQALMAGTPTVATNIGVEGLSVQNGKHALVADDPAMFAAHMEKLLRSETVWNRLSHAGRAHVLQHHGRQAVRAQLERSLAATLAREPKKLRLADLISVADPSADASYAQLVQRITDIVRTRLPAGAHAAVISKGDDALLKLGEVSGSHFPCTTDGVYAGYHPADSPAAVALLEAQRLTGTEFLVVPRTAFWWLEYYAQFREHLERHHRLMFADQDTCLIFDLRAEVRHET
jgi:O-antigen biosynthesis protein